MVAGSLPWYGKTQAPQSSLESSLVAFISLETENRLILENWARLRQRTKQVVAQKNKRNDQNRKRWSKGQQKKIEDPEQYPHLNTIPNKHWFPQHQETPK